ncbi:uncharacterized protein LOC126733756 [Anthonomus grandis grandis]|uniref:uncharacterized protein LOC126733756 n=1 Tax=Anthonomus grandis grandis TaxID=2921223 RepID=UPI0021669D8F|nr:uncharacterized protein LOC126733756 [Anthonomus grandis grandis]
MKFVEPVDVKKIFDSTDIFLFDVDGVLKLGPNPIPGAISFIKDLRRRNKQIGFVTNATSFSADDQRNRLSLFEATNDEIFTPHDAIVAYLQKINFQKDIFVISNHTTKKLLRESGYKIIQLEDITTMPIEESIKAFKDISEKTIEICKNVGAVLVDMDFRFSHVNTQIACTILRHFKDVLLLNSILDDSAPIGNNFILIGPKYYMDVIERHSNTKSLTLGKPATALLDALKPAFKITDPSRVMFFGDNVMTDISFGSNCGFQTFLVLTGNTTKEDYKEWNYPNEYKPSYVAESIESMVLP